MKEKRKLYILVFAIIMIFLFMKNDTSIPPQTVAPVCFEREDCKVPIKQGYCGVNYDCVSGKCYSSQIKCPEICYGDEDEDMDGVIDCKDSDCFDSIYCPCINTDYGMCLTNSCYCSIGSAKWVVTNGNGECICS